MNAKAEAWRRFQQTRDELIGAVQISQHEAGHNVSGYIPRNEKAAHVYAAAAVAEARAPLVEALEAAEWADHGTDGEEFPRCPVCGWAESKGKHWRKCPIAAALAEKGETG